MKKRILICEFHQETNTFNPIITDTDRFNGGGAFEGEEVFAGRMARRCAVRGGVDAIRARGGEVIPTIFMTSGSGGRVSAKAVKHFCQRLESYLQTEQIDGVYLALHGATCSEIDDDTCGNIVERVRKLVGDKPITASFDLHANITEKMLKNADIICGYNTYPHNDFYETGYRAAAFCMDLLEGKQVKTYSKAVPMLLPPAGYTTGDGMFRDLMDTAKAMVDAGEILDFTVFPVQPWLDIEEIASRIVVVGEDEEKANRCAEALAEKLWELREDAQPEMLSVDEIIDIAENNTTGQPVILSESADSPNGGCVGDSPVVAMRLLERGSTLRAGMFVVDPAAAEKAFAIGVGGVAEFSVGAGFTPGMPGPLKAEGRVLSLHDGNFRLEGPANRGGQGVLGRCAVVRFGTVDILLCPKCSSSGDPQLFRHFGIEPTLYDLIVVKANTSFRLPYGKFTNLIYCADTIGAGASNLKRLQWQKLPKGLYPFEDQK